jgi:hypothetical protein
MFSSSWDGLRLAFTCGANHTVTLRIARDTGVSDGAATCGQNFQLFTASAATDRIAKHPPYPIAGWTIACRTVRQLHEHAGDSGKVRTQSIQFPMKTSYGFPYGAARGAHACPDHVHAPTLHSKPYALTLRLHSASLGHLRGRIRVPPQDLAAYPRQPATCPSKIRKASCLPHSTMLLAPCREARPCVKG